MGFLNARLKAGLTQADAARKLGISAASICQWETGKTLPDAKRLLDIADIYCCTVDELLSSEKGEHYEQSVDQAGSS